MKHAVQALLVLLVGLTTATAQVVGPPQPLRFCDVCPGYTISYNAGKAEVYIRCPPKKDPWLTIKECSQPVVKRQPDGTSVDITCTRPVRT